MIQDAPSRTIPQPVFLKCSKISEIPSEDEFVVQFQTQNGHYTSFVPKQDVDLPNRRMKALIVAEVEDGVIVLMPAETLTSGPRLRVQNCEIDELLTSIN